MEATVTLPDGDADAWRLFQEKTAQGMDLLSSLPDKLIGYVFRFLPIMDVVRTSVLSKCWHRRWIRTPAINIYWDEKKDGLEVLDHVDKILRGRESSRLAIDKFHIYSYPVPPIRCLMERYDAWVRFAVDHQVKDLCFELKEEEDLVDEENTPEFYEFPKEIFDCQLMVKFYVRRCSFPCQYSSPEIRWESLRFFTIDTLHLHPDVMARVLGGCPVLERLELKNCFSRQQVGISSQEMRELVIHGYSIEDEDEECDNSLQICAPRLQSLRLLGSWRNKTMIQLVDVPPLNEAHLDFKEPDKCSVVEYILNTLLGNLCYAEKLFIGRYCLEVLPMKVLIQGNQWFGCRYLSIKQVVDNPGLVRIAKILTCTPNVKKLVIDLTPSEGKFVDGPFESNESDFGNMKCLAKPLVRVEIIGIDAAHVHELKYAFLLVKFLLKYSTRLEKMIFRTTKPWNEAYREKVELLADKVERFESGSCAAELVVTSSSFDGREAVIIPLPSPPYKQVPFSKVYVRRGKKKRQR